MYLLYLLIPLLLCYADFHRLHHLAGRDDHAGEAFILLRLHRRRHLEGLLQLELSIELVV